MHRSAPRTRGWIYRIISNEGSKSSKIKRHFHSDFFEEIQRWSWAKADEKTGSKADRFVVA
jgi:hypothetical protein